MDLDDMSSAELTMAFPATRMRVRKPPSVVVMVLVWLFLSVALTHVGAKVETPIVDDPLVMELVSWIENQGGAVDERQEIRLQESSHRRRGVFATAPIPAGTVLTSIPWELVVAADDPDDDDPCSAVDVVNRELRYMQGKSAGTPQYAPFIKVLQKYGTKPLMAWSREGQELLAAILGQNIPPSNFAKPIDWWKRDCGGDPDKDLLGLEALFLTVGDPSPNVMTPSEQFQTALVPFYGLYNHRDGAWLNTAMLDNKVSAVVVVKEGKPVGIITKTDTTKAYSKGVSLDASVKDIMTSDLKTVQHNVSRDRAARVIEGNKIHHAIVVGDQGQFLGIISSWDIAKECVLDDRAWPWIRHENGKAHVVSHPKA